MLIMVVERFIAGNPSLVGARFQSEGRMLPDDVQYLRSWISKSGDCCYQLMEAPSLSSLDPWVSVWSDLVDFEILEVLPSPEYWSQINTLSE